MEGRRVPRQHPDVSAPGHSRQLETGIAEPLRPARVLARPKKFAPLRSFSCGRRGRAWETGINKWVRDLYLGVEKEHTVIVIEDADGKLIGVCGFMSFPFSIGAGKPMGDAQRIHILATDRSYHGKRLEDGSRPGDALLRGVLEQIRIANGGRMPCVSALIEPENDRSHTLFSRHGFDKLPYAGEGDFIYVRPPEKRPSGLRSALPKRLFRSRPAT